MTTTVATVQKVNKAYFDLKASGENPTIAKIIKMLKGGSRSTIAPILRTLKEQEDRSQSPDFQVISQIDDNQLGVIRHFVAYTREKAQEDFKDEMVSALEDALEARNKEIEEMLQVTQDLRAELKITREMNEKLFASIRDMEQRISELTTQVAFTRQTKNES